MKKLATLLSIIIGGMVWQQMRYLSARRNRVQDRQPMLYPAERFHVITFLDTTEGQDVIDSVRALKQQIDVGPGTLIYAGQAAFTMPSTQLGPRNWDAVVLVQYPSLASYNETAASDGYKDALAAFDEAYSHGMVRNPVLNLAIHQALLVLAMIDIVTGNREVPPLVPSSETSGAPPQLNERVADLQRMSAVNDHALFVFNLSKPGTPEQQAADASYGRNMMTRMARLGHGPMHIGRAVTVEGDAEFENAIVVYYPGASYFAQLVGSTFFGGIIGDKQLGDTQVVPTVPITDRL